MQHVFEQSTTRSDHISAEIESNGQTASPQAKARARRGLARLGPVATAIILSTLPMSMPDRAEAQGLRGVECGSRFDARPCTGAENRPGLRSERAVPRAVAPAVRPHAPFIGRRLAAADLHPLARPAAFGLAPLRRGLTYAWIGGDIYIVERNTGLVVALALVAAAAQ